MDSLTSTIKRCNLQLKLDNPTEGFGNCFPNGVVQQCRRPEIRTWLQTNKPWAIFNGQQNLRNQVTHFALKSRHKTIADFRVEFEQVLGPVDNISWEDYWNEMVQDGTWVDHTFVQMIAWYMELDILILTTSSQPNDPFIFISGNINKMPAFTSGPPLLLGNYTNVHYQSLLPRIMTAEKRQEPKHETIIQDEKSEDFIFIQKDKTVTFPTSETGKLQCPFCRELFTSISKHINSHKCVIHQLHIDKKEFIDQLDSFREGYRLEMSRKRHRKSRAKLREEKGPAVIKAEQNRNRQKNRVKLREEKGPEVIKAEQNRVKQHSRANIREEKGSEVIKAEQNKQKQNQTYGREGTSKHKETRQ